MLTPDSSDGSPLPETSLSESSTSVADTVQSEGFASSPVSCGSVTRLTSVSLGCSGVSSSVSHSLATCALSGQFSDPALVTAFTNSLSQASSSALTEKVRVSVSSRDGIVQSIELGSPESGVLSTEPADGVPRSKSCASASTSVRSSCRTTSFGATPSVCTAFRV